MWFFQGNTIVAVNTAKSPDDVIQIGDNADGNITVTIRGNVEDAVAVGDFVWCCSESSVCMIDVSSRTPIRYWTLDDLKLVFSKQSSRAHPTRKHVTERLASIEPKKILCLARVCDTLWVGCDNGAIFVVSETASDGDKIHLLATLWCRPVLNHVVDGKGGDLPSLAITRMTQIGDRVMVCRNHYPVEKKRADQTVVAEIFQALTSSQFQELSTYYNAQYA